MQQAAADRPLAPSYRGSSDSTRSGAPAGGEKACTPLETFQPFPASDAAMRHVLPVEIAGKPPLHGAGQNARGSLPRGRRSPRSTCSFERMNPTANAGDAQCPSPRQRRRSLGQAGSRGACREEQAPAPCSHSPPRRPRCSPPAAPTPRAPSTCWRPTISSAPATACRRWCGRRRSPSRRRRGRRAAPATAPAASRTTQAAARSARTSPGERASRRARR